MQDLDGLQNIWKQFFIAQIMLYSRIKTIVLVYILPFDFFYGKLHR